MAVGRNGHPSKERERGARIPAWAVVIVAATTPAIACRSAMKVFGATDGGVGWQDASSPTELPAPRDVGRDVGQDAGQVVIRLDGSLRPDTRPILADARLASDSPSQPETRDSPPEIDAATPRDGVPAIDVAPARCAEQTISSGLFPATGTIRGPKVDGVTCENGLGTHFHGPGAANYSSYTQSLYTTSWYSSSVRSSSQDDSLVYGFLLAEPTRSTADLSGWVGATSNEPGIYTGVENCGYLDLVVSLPIPAGIVCSIPFAPCDPGCEGVGEMWICAPAHPRLYYAARSSAACGSNQEPAQGNWELTLTSASALSEPHGYLNFQTHGHLAATLVNRDDASDSVVVSVDF
jgi:hypothetical protein